MIVCSKLGNHSRLNGFLRGKYFSMATRREDGHNNWILGKTDNWTTPIIRGCTRIYLWFVNTITVFSPMSFSFITFAMYKLRSYVSIRLDSIHQNRKRKE